MPPGCGVAVYDGPRLFSRLVFSLDLTPTNNEFNLTYYVHNTRTIGSLTYDRLGQGTLP